MGKAYWLPGAFAAFGVFGIALQGYAAVTTVSAGQTVSVTDSTVAQYADGFAFADETGVVEFDTSSAPTMDISGNGTVKKVSSAEWTMSTPIPSFTGDYVLEGGGVVKMTADVRSLFGAESASGGALYVKPGNTLEIAPSVSGAWANWTVCGNRPIRISGTGATGAGGAIKVNASHYNNTGIWNHLVLDDDATIRFDSWCYQCQMGGSIVSGDGEPKTLTLSGKGELQFNNTVELAENISVNVVGDGGTQKVVLRNTRGETKIAESEVSAFSLNNAMLQFYNRANGASETMWMGGLNRPLNVSGNSVLQHDGQFLPVARIDPTNTVMGNVSGPVNIAAGATLSSRVTKQYQTVLSGGLTGSGTLEVPGRNDNRGRTYISGANETFTGSIAANANGSYTPWLILGNPLSAGRDFSKISAQNIVLGVDARNWTKADVRALGAGANFGATGSIGIDPTWCENKYAEFDYPGYDAMVPVGCGADGTVLLKNVATSAAEPLRVTTSDGTLRVKGEGSPIYVSATTEVTYTHELASERSVLEFNNAEVVGVASPVIGERGFHNANANGEFGQAVLRFKDSTYRPQNIHCEFADQATDALVVRGSDSKLGAAIEIEGNSVVTSKIVATGKDWARPGMVYQRGGKVTLLGHPSDWAKTSRIGTGTEHGYYEMFGGELQILGLFGSYDSHGSFFQYGGNVTLGKAIGSDAAPIFAMCQANLSCFGELYVAGGTFDVGPGRMELAGGMGQVRLCQVTASGAGTIVDFRDTNLAGGNEQWTDANDHTRVFYNMKDGGTLRTGAFGKASPGSDYAVNFDGGILKLGAYGGDFFKSRPNTPLVLVHDGGATIDTDGKDARTEVPVVAAAGKGIVSIPLPAPIKNIGFPPVVVIYGDGRGASAVAEFDSEKLEVSGIKIISPGTGYTQATAKLLYARAQQLGADITCVLGDNAGTGGFTKAGEGVLTMSGANTWGGKTVVKGGALKLGAASALPAGTDVLLSGGDLDLNGMQVSVGNVTYAAGGGALLNAQNATFVGTIEMEISTADLAAGKTIALKGDFAFDGVALKIAGTAADLDENVRYTIATTDGSFSGAPSIEIDESFNHWTVAVRSDAIRLFRKRGLKVIIR